MKTCARPLLGLLAVLFIAGSATAQTPHVVSVAPAQNQLDVSKTASVNATFDVAMNQATLSTASVLVHGSISGSHAGSIAYNGVSRTVTFVPTVPFQVGDVVTVILTPAIQSGSGVPLARAFAWSFTVQATSGAGVFQLHADYDSGDSTYGLAAGDFNRDGLMDVVATSTEGNFVGVMAGLPGGGFAFGANYLTGTRPMDVCLADLDRDGDLDMAVANSGSNSVSVLKNNGSGMIVTNLSYATHTGPRAICVADINGDGHIDILTANATGNTVSVLWNGGTGTFGSKTDFSAGGAAYDVAVADFNNDGAMDVVTADWSGSGICAVLLNDGTGTLGTPSMVGYGGAIGVYPADVNHDGWVDLIEAGNGPDAALITFNQGNGVFGASADMQYSVAGYPNAVVAADFQRDGDLDIALACSWQTSGHTVSTLRNDGTGAFAPRVNFDVDLGPFNIAAADFNGDGSLDLATANITNGNVSVLLNQCCEGTTGNVNLSTSQTPDLSDLSLLISYLTQTPRPILPCAAEANVNTVGSIDLSDLSLLISYLTATPRPVLPNCL